MRRDNLVVFHYLRMCICNLAWLEGKGGIWCEWQYKRGSTVQSAVINNRHIHIIYSNLQCISVTEYIFWTWLLHRQNKQGQCKAWHIPLPLKIDLVTLTFDIWPWKSIGFQILLRTKYVPSLVKIHWRMLILECSQGCYRVKIRPCDLENQ
jgi:hypothetical protein